jgi:dihydrofolate synthase/folylpolyglutamate synthase
MQCSSLQDWLEWQSTLHPEEIELGLERVAAVWQQLHPDRFSPTVITVGGSNGKGSAVAMLGAILNAAGYRVGCYTSPHLWRYNERIRIDGREASDDEICRAFEQVERARGETQLTYFEFGTLAALHIFSQQQLDIVVLEVGLGGRLDAVNILDPDVALITTISIEHTEWLGGSRDEIALEKGGILRSGNPAVIGDTNPPAALLELAQSLNLSPLVAGRDYLWQHHGQQWDWSSGEEQLRDLPLPQLKGEFQLQNGAAVLAVIAQLQSRHQVEPDAIRQGLQSVELAGRFQLIEGEVTTILDVAHNPEAATALAASLRSQACEGSTMALFSSLADKDIPAVVAPLIELVDSWYLAPLQEGRAAPVDTLQRALMDGGIEPSSIRLFPTPAAAYSGAQDDAIAGDRIVVFGSFYTVAGIRA